MKTRFVLSLALLLSLSAAAKQPTLPSRLLSGLPVSESKTAELKGCFESYYAPEYEYEEDSKGFKTDYYTIFSPYHVIPQWERAEFLPKGLSGISKRGTYLVPLITERTLQAGYRFSNQKTDPLASAYHPVAFYLAFERSGRHFKVYGYAVLNDLPEKEEFSGLLVEFEPNTGKGLRKYYYQSGELRGASEYYPLNKPDRLERYQTMMDQNRLTDYNPEQNYVEHDMRLRMANQAHTPEYKQFKRSVEGRKALDQATQGDMIRLNIRYLAGRNPQFPK